MIHPDPSSPGTRLRAIAGVAALAAALAGCGATEDFFGGKDNAEPPAELTDFQASATVERVWSRDVGAGADKQYLKLRPAIEAGRIFAAGRGGDVAAYDTATGERLWETDLDVPISGGPGVGENLVVVGTSDGEVLAVDAGDGSLRWRASLSSEVLAPPVAGQGVVVARTGDGKLFGLAAADGSQAWVYDRTVPVLTLRGTSAPAVSHRAAVAGFDSGTMVSVALRDGRTDWESRVAVPRGRTELERLVDIDADPVIADGVIYVVTFQGHVAALDLDTGSVAWRRDMSSHAGLAVDRSSVYVTDESSHVWSLDRSSSASVWRQQKLNARAVTAPAVIGNLVAVGDFDGYVHWMRADDGQFVARERVGEGIIAQPLAHAGMLFVYDRSGTITAFRPR